MVACNAKNWQKLRKSLSLKLWSKIFDLSQAEGKKVRKKGECAAECVVNPIGSMGLVYLPTFE